MKKIAGYYIRVSSDRQKEEQSIDSQREQTEEEIKRNGDNLSEKFRYEDQAFTGSTMNRPALTKLFDDLAEGSELEALYITDLDRLARDLKDQIDIFERLAKYEVKVIHRGRPLEESPEGKMLLQQQGMFAEYRRNRITEDCKRGKRYWTGKGRIIHAFPRYGYQFNGKKKDEKKILINPAEKKIVQLMFSLYRIHQSYYKVMKELHKRGIVTRGGSPFGAKHISNILRNEAYIGKWHYWMTEAIEPKNRRSQFTKIKNSSTRVRDKKEWDDFKVPAIINEDTFYDVQDIIDKKRKVYNQPKQFFLLRNLLYCSKCGARLYGYRTVNKQGREYTYYRCSRKTLSHTGINKPTCDAGLVDGKSLEQSIWTDIKKTLTTPGTLKKCIAILNEDDNNTIMAEREKRDLLQQKGEIKKKKDKLFELYEDDSIDKPALSERMEKHNQEEKRIDRLIREAQVKLHQKSIKKELLQVLKDISGNIQAFLDGFKDEQKRIFLNLVVNKIICDSETLEYAITGHLPLEDMTKVTSDKDAKLPILALCPKLL